MAALTKQRMTVAEFLVWAEAQAEGRYELVDGEVQRMSPERVRHNLGKAEIWFTLKAAVRAAGLANTAFTDGMSVVINDARTREPDAIVAEGSSHDPDALTCDDPQVVVEVVSPNSEKRDAVDKLADYFTLPSVLHYLLVRQEDGVVEHHARTPAGPIVKSALRAGETLRLDPPGFDVAVSDLLGTGGCHSA